MVGTKIENEARDWRNGSAGKVLASESESPEPIPQEKHNTYKLSSALSQQRSGKRR